MLETALESGRESREHFEQENAGVAKFLTKVDWDFKVRVVTNEIEGVHPYPAKFISDLPAAILDALPLRKGSIVLDPFCGSGTTVAEAQRRGLESVGVDLNPIACLMARVKTSPIPDGIEVSVAHLVGAVDSGFAPVPAIPNLSHWFKSPIQAALARLTAAVETIPEIHQDFVRLAISSIIVRVSNQESDTRYAAVEKPLKPDDVKIAFQRSCDRLLSALRSRNYDLVSATIINSDLLQVDTVALRGKIGAIITSPPYPNAYEYWLYHKYRMWWLGYDPLKVKEKEIGARAHFFKKNRHTSQTFVDQMTSAFRKFSEMLTLDGWVCFVVGRSIIHGETIDNAAIIRKVGEDSGFELVYEGTRNVLSTRKSFNLAHANIKQENIVVMRRSFL
ncbi:MULTISPECIES: DNA methyltransferase [Rhizobium/Agrobacterium group]|uniref:DNA methyltransferase n=1 Tax=Agrobacterium salinitolerans TaxID=1183413 RepID=A0A9X3QZ41_9HYPH|nr:MULTISPECIES: DNA methyltransferase [Rhizobium/Agrobacterium group]MCZ7938017.1 DNA methyltransferase [Agrobacterium salinitolerans]